MSNVDTVPGWYLNESAPASGHLLRRSDSPRCPVFRVPRAAFRRPAGTRTAWSCGEPRAHGRRRGRTCTPWFTQVGGVVCLCGREPDLSSQIGCRSGGRRPRHRTRRWGGRQRTPSAGTYISSTSAEYRPESYAVPCPSFTPSVSSDEHSSTYVQRSPHLGSPCMTRHARSPSLGDEE